MIKRYKLPIAVIAIVLVAIGVPRIFLVPYLERQLQAEFAQVLQADEVRVDVQAPWGWELLLGHVPGFDFAASDAVIDGLQISRVKLFGEQIRFDPRLFWQEQDLVLTDVSAIGGEGTVTEAALNAFLWERVDPDRLLQIEISPEGVDLVGTLSLWNIEWTVTVRGELEVLNGTSLRYVLKDIGVQETRIPNLLLEVLSENYELVVDFGVFPYPVEIKDVHLQEQQIKVILGGL
ncbi:MAG: DUF2993 domain-containing protein [Firmicutes bacterium]|nr:DUF2993 domain-containing protein [Bacillota bacterium]